MRRDQLTLYALTAAILALPFGLDTLRARAATQWSDAQSYEDVYYLPPSEWLPVFSLGWDEALADLIWMRALVYYGDEIVNSGDVEFVFEYGSAIETLDPEFVAIYPWVGTAGLYQAEAIDLDDVNRVIEFMERGAQRHPDDCTVAWQLGAVLAYELPPMLDEVELTNAARERALPYLMRAAQLGCAPRWAVLTNVAIAGRAGRLDMALRHLEEMMDRTSDPAIRQRILERYRQLASQQRAELFLAEHERIEDERRAAFPYVDTGLFLLLGERPPVDVDAPIREGLPAALAVEE